MYVRHPAWASYTEGVKHTSGFLLTLPTPSLTQSLWNCSCAACAYMIMMAWRWIESNFNNLKLCYLLVVTVNNIYNLFSIPDSLCFRKSHEKFCITKGLNMSLKRNKAWSYSSKFSISYFCLSGESHWSAYNCLLPSFNAHFSLTDISKQCGDCWEGTKW